MKNITNIINGLKTLAKYSAYIIVIIDVINFATERLEALTNNQPKEKNNDN